MRPATETLHEFMRLYDQEFHESLTEDEAAEMWTRVMDLYLLLYRPKMRHEANTSALDGAVASTVGWKSDPSRHPS